jgi:Fe2+ transport system protein FeoA
MTTTCPLCGFEYKPGDGACHASGCPLASSACRKLHCPRCGYSVPDEGASALVRLFRRLLGGTRPPQRETTTAALFRLTDTPAGTRGAVSQIDATPALSAQLAAQGIVPGTVLRLAQRRPAFIVEVGETVLAMERAVAEAVWIQPGDPAITASDEQGT